MKSSPANPDDRVGVLTIGIAMGVPLPVEVVAVGGMTYTVTKEEAAKGSMRERAAWEREIRASFSAKLLRRRKVSQG
jgi:hypothetical protein